MSKLFITFASSKNKQKGKYIMTKLVLNNPQIAVLQRLAEITLMDSWFNLDDNGIVRDRENNNRIMSTRKACKQLVHGLTPEDLECLDGGELYTLIWFAANVLKTF